MPQELYLKQKFEITAIERSKEVTAIHKFSVNDDGYDIRIVVSEDLKQIEAETKYPISDDLHHTIYSHLIIHESYIESY